MKRGISLLLTVGLLLSLAACGLLGTGGEIRPFIPSQDSGELYFYGVIRRQDTYYVQVLEEYREEPTEEELLCVPLAEELGAYFQPVGWVGGWCPEQYLTARELASACKAGKISTGVRFAYEMENGSMVWLQEYNYYNDSNVTTGDPSIPEEAILNFGPDADSGLFYLYGVTEENGTYYACVLRQPQETDPEASFLYAPLAYELEAYFQEEGWVGGWCPVQYLSAEELLYGWEEGTVTWGAEFSCLIEDGRLVYLEENNYYLEALPEPMPEEEDLPVEEVPELLPDVLSVREKTYEPMPVLTSQNEVTEYFLWNLLWNRTEFECYLSRDLAPDENTGCGILNTASENMAAYYLFGAFMPYDMYVLERKEEQGLYAKVRLDFQGTEYDAEAKAEALEYVKKHPVPEGGFTDYESERAYALEIHNYLACKVTYSPIGYNPKEMLYLDRYEAKQEAYTILADDQDSTVCAGYARGFALIAHYAGINVAWVMGNETEMESHAWNILYPCDGSEPVLIDVTWDDTASDDRAGQTEVETIWFYIPLPEDSEHVANGTMMEFLNYLNDPGRNS